MVKSVKKSYSRKKCPKGSISRVSYTYLRKSTGKKVKVKSACIKSRGLRSLGVKTKRVLPTLKKGTLKQYGYSTKDSDEKRHIALKKAVKAYGYSGVVKKLNAVKLLTKNTFPSTSRIYSKDLKYVQKDLGKFSKTLIRKSRKSTKKSRRKSRKSTKKSRRKSRKTTKKSRRKSRR